MKCLTVIFACFGLLLLVSVTSGQTADMTPKYFDKDMRVTAPEWKIPDLTAKNKHKVGEAAEDLTEKAQLQATSRKDLGARPDVVVTGKPLSRSEVRIGLRTYTDRVAETTDKMNARPATSTSQLWTAPTSIYAMSQTHSYRTFALAGSRGNMQTYMNQGPTLSTVAGR